MIYAQVDEAGRKELEQEIKANPEMKWYRCLKVIDQSSKGQSVPEIGALFYLDPSTVRSYIHRYNNGGLAGLKPDYGQGRPPDISLSKAEMEELLKRSPSQFKKLETGARNWTQELLSLYFWHYHQLTISQSGISDALKRVGIVWRRAKKK